MGGVITRLRGLGIMIIAVCLNPISVLAQDDWQFVDETADRLPDITTLADKMDVGDVDGDGDLDIIVGCSEVPWPFTPGYEQIFINDGRGYFSQENSPRLPLINDETRVVLLLDSDNDLDLDLLVGSANGDTNYLAINDGGGYFTMDLERIPVTTTALGGADFGDIDNDGDLDLYASYSYYPDLLLINDGTSYFMSVPQQIPEILDGSSSVRMADFDGDLDLDLLLVAYPSGPILLLNDGTGYFQDETEGRIYEDFALWGNVNDIDNDGDIDILLMPERNCSVFINDGLGFFTDESEERFPDLGEGSPADVITFADVDNDTDFDLILAHSPYAGQYLLLNDGAGYFQDDSDRRMPPYRLSTRDAMLADYDGDGDADYFRVGHADYGNHIYINTLESTDSIPPTFMNAQVLDETLLEAGPYPLRVAVNEGVSLIRNQVDASIRYSVDSIDYVSTPMIFVGGFIFRGEIPAFDSGVTVYYYYLVEDDRSNEATFPPGAPEEVLSFTYSPIPTNVDSETITSPIGIKCYPNPFNSAAAVTYTLSEAVHINLSVCNLLGQKVATLFDGMLQRGEHTVIWNGSAFPSGIYIVRLDTPTASEKVKMVLLK